MRIGRWKSFFALLVFALLAGCQGGGGEGGESQPASDAISGGKAGKSKLVGVWDIDVLQMMKDSGQLEGMPEGIDIEAMAAQMAMSVEFRGDGTLTWTTRSPRGENVEGGTWELVESGESSLTIRSVDEQGGTADVKLTFEDDDHVTGVSDLNEPMKLVRRK